MGGKPTFGASAAPALRILTTRTAGYARAVVRGDLDSNTAACLTDWAHSFIAHPAPAIRLDLSGLWFVDVAGMRALACACRALLGACDAVEVAGLPETATRLMELTGAQLTGVRLIIRPPAPPPDYTSPQPGKLGRIVE
jgi:anti-anti-sigma factor